MTVQLSDVYVGNEYTDYSFFYQTPDSSFTKSVTLREFHQTGNFSQPTRDVPGFVLADVKNQIADFQLKDKIIDVRDILKIRGVTFREGTDTVRRLNSLDYQNLDCFYPFLYKQSYTCLASNQDGVRYIQAIDSKNDDGRIDALEFTYNGIFVEVTSFDKNYLSSVTGEFLGMFGDLEIAS